jgi:hypothetical protein
MLELGHPVINLASTGRGDSEKVALLSAQKTLHRRVLPRR